MLKSFYPFIYLVILLFPALFTGGLLAFAGNAADGIRLGCLSLLGCAIFYYAVKRQSKLLYILTVMWWLIFWLDSVLRATSWFLFDSDTNAYFIMQAIANTSRHETLEFLQTHHHNLIILLSLLSMMSLVYFSYLFKYFKAEQLNTLLQQRFSRYVIIFCSITMITSYAMRPARALFPVLYWQNYYAEIQEFQDGILKHKNLQQQWAQYAQNNLIYQKSFQQQQTHVLVLSESITSLNLGVCGYDRETTPELKKRLDQLYVFCQAYSPYPSTINSLRVNLTNSSAILPDDEPTESLISYAEAAGFKVYWLSNQDDSYISSLFGSNATVSFYNNKRSGRSSQALDEQLLPAYFDALADPYPKKLIILHLIGAHPNYAARYPVKFDHFNNDSNDETENLLQANHIGLWVQSKRNEYDNAILYQDWLISQLFDPLQQNTTLGQRSFMFLSDHGNEVGHELDYAGHSPNTIAGYQVPVIVWHDQMKLHGINSKDIIDTAELDTNLMHLMGIRDKNDLPQLFWLNSDYQFKPNAAWPYWQKKTS
ncbi:MAG: phosphoethanolamine transferase [Acinetobacter populi]|jgi:heptose-I-phosphate ethanolaminephosphotransferase|uniref:phosphoethanolamine transferase n=1 Tax=Acinetobacter populi TaxID=1582270 RepID=UPI0023546DE0|nr:phosphoethanolamine transferase [Acinetobacter populi]MCH4247972.1 phosphoethanolamine transferase [Acinetobacter populi]